MTIGPGTISDNKKLDVPMCHKQPEIHTAHVQANHTHLNRNKTIVSVIISFGWTVCTSAL